MLLTIFCDVIKQSLCQRDSRGLRCILVSVERAGISQLRLRSPIFDKSIDSAVAAFLYSLVRSYAVRVWRFKEPYLWLWRSRPKLSGFFARVI